MWMNFLFSAGVVSLVVGQMSREINKRERAIANFREEYLKQEQVIALGVASAQVTHQLATPITTVQLLADELSEALPDNPILQDMQHELTRCRKSIEEFRQLALDTKAQKCSVHSCQQIVDVLQEQININFPRAQLLLTGDFSLSKSFVYADASLTPAILNLIQNGIRASLDNGSQEIELFSDVTEARWQLTIRDFGKGFSKNKLTELGATLVESHQGLGMAVFLSHASLERLGGKLTLANHQDGGAVVTVQLPLVAHEV
jgi:two-component system sensor histidine kinase RegB